MEDQRVVVYVSGGVVQSVSSTKAISNLFSVEIVDEDNISTEVHDNQEVQAIIDQKLEGLVVMC